MQHRVDHELDRDEQDAAPDERGQLVEVAAVLDPQEARHHVAPQPAGEPHRDAHQPTDSRLDIGKGEGRQLHVMPEEGEAKGERERVDEVRRQAAVPRQRDEQHRPRRGGEDGAADERRPERLAGHYRAPVAAGGCRYWSSQSSTVPHHTRRLRGFSTPWPSSGKYRNLAGTPTFLSAVKAW